MHVAIEDTAAGQLVTGDPAGLVTATLLAAFARSGAGDPDRSA